MHQRPRVPRNRAEDLPSISDRRNGVEPRRIGGIGRVTSRIALILHAAGLAVVDVVGRDSLAAQLLRRLDEGGRQAHLDVPLNVAVEEEDTGVIDLEAQHGIRVGIDGDGVAAWRGLIEGQIMPCPRASVAGRTVQNLELMSVHVERMDGTIEIVDNNFDDITITEDERVYIPIDDGVGVGSASGGHGVQSRYVLSDVRLVVEASAGTLR